MEESISFFSEDTDFQLLDQKLVSEWIFQIVKRHKFTIAQIDFIFCSDEYLRKINKDYLNHDYYTDIITFPYHPEGSKEIFSDIYISVDRVQENSEEFKCTFIDELHRVMIHGVLHLLGFDDKEEKSKSEMRRAEDLALALRMF